MAGRRDPTAAATKWADRLGSSGAAVEAGVRNVAEAPTMAAARNLEKYKAKVMDALASGKTKRNMEATTLSQWQEPMLKQGIERMAQGAQNNKGKMVAFNTALYSYQDSYLPAIHRMPNITKADNKARMLANFDKMSEFSYNRR